MEEYKITLTLSCEFIKKGNKENVIKDALKWWKNNCIDICEPQIKIEKILDKQ